MPEMLTAGFLNLLKPPGMTSHDVVEKVRRLFPGVKAGHLGTLDPMACGVLPIALGKATRLVSYLENTDKEYRAELTLGLESDTQDIWGQVRESGDCRFLREENIRRAFAAFTGTITQVPPMVSAVKVQGKKLYEYARQGQEIIRPARQVRVEELRIVKISGLGEKYCRVLFHARVSKGTYIRTLCADIGKYLGTGGLLSFLLRTRSGPFTLDQTVMLDEISRDKIIDVFPVVEKILPVVTIDESLCNRVKHGQKIPGEALSSVAGERVAVQDAEGNVVAVLKKIRIESKDKTFWQPEKVLV